MKLINATLCLSLVTGLLVVAPAAQAQEQLAASMCDYVKADDKNRFRKLLSDNRLRLRNIYDGVVCDGLSLIRFAVKNNAAGAGEFIIKQLPAAQITASGDIAWAESNQAGSALIAVLKARAGGGE
jgi:D-alanyl-D-alanine carboxypeptidase